MWDNYNNDDDIVLAYQDEFEYWTLVEHTGARERLGYTDCTTSGFTWFGLSWDKWDRAVKLLYRLKSNKHD